MIIAPDFVCIHLQKCGGSFLREYLTANIQGAKYNNVTHDRACDIPKQHRTKPILGTIRNPWEWYVSWYAGTQRREALKGPFRVLHPNGRQTSFAKFMEKVLHLKKKIHNTDFGLINRLGIGVYTYRYIQSYCRNPDAVFEQLRSQSLVDDMMFKIYLCRTEKLRNDLTNFLITTPPGITAKQRHALITISRVNTSQHDMYRNYYSPQLQQCVEQMDKYIVDEFGYIF